MYKYLSEITVDFSTGILSYCVNIMTTLTDPWILTYTPAPAPAPQRVIDECGVLVGNGKIGVVSSFGNDIGFDGDSLITGNVKYVQGVYSNNVVQGFRLGRLRFFTNAEDSSVTYTYTGQTLNMSTAILTSNYTVREIATNNIITVAIDAYAPYNLPFCLMQTVRITPVPGFTGNSVLVFHEPIAASDTNRLGVPAYDNSLMDYAGSAAHVLNGVQEQRMNMTSTGGDVTVAFASTYWTDTSGSIVNVLGFNVYRHDEARCYCKMQLTGLNAGVETKLHLLSTQMTTADYVAPLEEVKRICLYLAKKPNAASSIRAAHVLEWSKNWEHTVEIAPKTDDTGITLEEKQAIIDLQRKVNYAIYNFWSCFRESARLELNQASFSILDTEGSMLFEGDIWILPLLCMLRPEAARSVLEYRYKTLVEATQLASSLGYKGAKFPSVNDVLGYSNALYWEIGSAMHIHNTALVAINAWNYYRTVNDKEWLSTRGFPILRSTAEFLISKVEIDADMTYHLRDVIGLTGKVSSDLHGLSVHLLRFAVKCAIEACYELAYAVPEAWSSVFFELQSPKYTELERDVLKIDAVATSATDVNLTIIEPWLILMPLYNSLYFSPENMHTLSAFKKNLDYYTPRVAPTFVNHPYNVVSRAILNGIFAQSDPSPSLQDFKTELDTFLASTTYGNIFGNLVMAGIAKKRNSLVMSAMLLSIILQGIAQIVPAGGVSEGRFYYEEMRIKSRPAANMPVTWRYVKVYGVGKNNDTLTTLNSSLYIPCGCP